MIHERMLNGKIPFLELKRDVTKHLKRGHRWIFADCFHEKDKHTGVCFLKDINKELIAFGISQGDTQMRFRLLFLTEEKFYKKNNLKDSIVEWSKNQWAKALALRACFPNVQTNSYRLINGEGDGFPGLTIDIYGDTAVIKHDHKIMEELWDRKQIAHMLQRDLPFLKCVYYKRRNDEEVKGESLIGELSDNVKFMENGVYFLSNIKDAAKTGFFLDQRDNRFLISKFSKDKTVLNLFSYTGGFSVFAALGGAKEVTSVDIAKAAIAASDLNFEVNGFKNKHHAIAADAFKFIEDAVNEKKKWQLVINDPPSFAPNAKSVDSAVEAYTKIFSQSIKLVESGGLFAASSCSSHITHEVFLKICTEAFSKARARGTLVYFGGQPSDHPFPLIMDELRYLKFALFRLD